MNSRHRNIKIENKLLFYIFSEIFNFPLLDLSGFGNDKLCIEFISIRCTENK